MNYWLTKSILVGGKAQATTRLLASVFSRQFAPTSSIQNYDNAFKLSSVGLINNSRHLYSDASLGMEKLEKVRESKSQIFMGSSKERYVKRLEQYLEENDSKSFLKDDLVNMVGIADSERDLDLIENLIANIEPDQRPIFRGWGTTLMRLYYKMNQLDRACKNIKDLERFGDFFDQRSCYKILLAMLFNAGRYNEVVDYYHLANSRLKSPEGNEKLLSTLAFAALAKINNPEALRKAEELFSKFEHDEKTPTRSIQYLSYLALNNGNPKLAANIIARNVGKQYLPVKNLKLMSLLALDRLEDVLFQLREYVNFIRHDSVILLRSTLGAIRDSIDKIQEQNVRQELNDLLVDIEKGGHVSDATLEDLMFKEINDYIRTTPDFGRNQISNQRWNARSMNKLDYRPGQNHQNFDGEQSRRQYQPKPPVRRFNYQNMDMD